MAIMCRPVASSSQKPARLRMCSRSVLMQTYKLIVHDVNTAWASRSLTCPQIGAVQLWFDPATQELGRERVHESLTVSVARQLMVCNRRVVEGFVWRTPIPIAFGIKT